MSAPQQLSSFNNQIPPRYTIKNITAAYTVTGADYGSILSCTGTTSYALSLTPAASVGTGFNVWIWNQTATIAMNITITPNASETVDGVTTLILRQGEGTQIISDGTNWQTGDKKTMRGYAENYVATATRPVAIANRAIALSNSYASGTDSFAAVIATNTSTYGAQATSAIAIGLFAKASGNGAIAIGGYGGVIASGNGSIAIGGGYNITGASAAARNSVAIGDGASVPTTTGKYNLSADYPFVAGAAQHGVVVLVVATTGASATVLSSDGAAAGASNQLILPNNSAYTFSILVVARQSAAGGTASASWQITGLIRREGTAASTTLVASTVTTISNVPAWTIAVTADTTNGGLTITATGAASTNIRWVATAQTSEVTYA